MAEADPQIADNEQAEAVPASPGRRWGRLAAMISLPVLLLVGGLLYWQSLQGKVSTDNAYVKQDMVAVGAEVGGKIVEVKVKEDQRVAAGDLLFRVDPEPFELDLAARTRPSPTRRPTSSRSRMRPISRAPISPRRAKTSLSRAAFSRGRKRSGNAASPPRPISMPHSTTLLRRRRTSAKP